MYIRTYVHEHPVGVPPHYSTRCMYAAPAGFLFTWCALMHPHTYTHTHTHTRTHTHTYTPTHTHTYVHTYVRTPTRIHIQTSTHLHSHTYTHTYVHSLVHTYTRTPTHIHTYTHTPTPTLSHPHCHTHTVTHTRMHSRPPDLSKDPDPFPDITGDIVFVWRHLCQHDKAYVLPCGTFQEFYESLQMSSSMASTTLLARGGQSTRTHTFLLPCALELSGPAVVLGGANCVYFPDGMSSKYTNRCLGLMAWWILLTHTVHTHIHTRTHTHTHRYTHTHTHIGTHTHTHIGTHTHIHTHTHTHT